MAGGPVRCALIGVGMMGTEHAAILAASPSAELVVACDTDPGAAVRLPAGVRLTADLDDALDTPGLEAVVIATPQSHHLTAVRAALGRGLAVLCEKPVAHTLADADAIAALAGCTWRTTGGRPHVPLRPTVPGHRRCGRRRHARCARPAHQPGQRARLRGSAAGRPDHARQREWRPRVRPDAVAGRTYRARVRGVVLDAHPRAGARGCHRGHGALCERRGGDVQDELADAQHPRLPVGAPVLDPRLDRPGLDRCPRRWHRHRRSGHDPLPVVAELSRPQRRAIRALPGGAGGIPGRRSFARWHPVAGDRGRGTFRPGSGSGRGRVDGEWRTGPVSGAAA